MPGADASQYTSFKKYSANQRGDTQTTDPKSVNRMTQYIPRVSNISNLGGFLPSLTKTITTGGSNSSTIILTASDLIAGRKDIVLEDVLYTIVNGTGETICLDFGIIGDFTLANNQTFTAPSKPDPIKLGTTETLQFSQGACSGGSCTIV